jgi:hypothetical protein
MAVVESMSINTGKVKMRLFAESNLCFGDPLQDDGLVKIDTVRKRHH